MKWGEKSRVGLFFCLGLSLSSFADDLIKPIPLQAVSNPQKAALGKDLFSDPQLSKDGTVSCLSCHNLAYGGADSEAVSRGVGGRSGSINAPTVFNARYNLAQFWDGRAKDLKAQAAGPIVNPVEMASTVESVVQKLSKDPKYQKRFREMYPQGITIETISDALAEFEKTLVTPNARFDSYLRGNITILTQKEKEGFELFKSRGCIACHNGMNIGGNMYQRFGVFAQYKDRYNTLGRFNVTKQGEDKYYFKVPSLRNIEKTAPYFHDGSAKTLEDAVQKMAYYQLGRKLSKEEIEKIIAFLRTLTGELPKNVL
ncbi:MAG: cytochrome-c peroxidase [Sulfuricurvum sp.]|jgi:cytochrome c peroxidase|uniref:cytochrome-c peroxidase n=1 Tax=Sulfuricurvum sp. TaxID=2025608 RepID=UPI0025E6C8B6|nr:cytochrome-c peroxidase [Sulfuricurvum sp.]MCK9372205.1 cytochrome-c peroxidase [Sulfuricurvum sp.]